MKNVIISAVGVVGSFLASCFGGWTESLTTLLIFMGIDFLTGFICAAVFHKSQKTETGALESKASFKGLCRKGVILLIVLVGHRIDLAIGASYVRDAVCIAFIVNETLSIVENAGLMGVPIPKVITNAIEILKKKGADKNEQNS